MDWGSGNDCVTAKVDSEDQRISVQVDLSEDLVTNGKEVN